MPATLRELAARFDCELHGDGDVVVERVGTLSAARTGAVTFLANPLYRSELKDTRASAVILEPRFQAESPVACLVTRTPYVAYAHIASFLHPTAAPRPGVHRTAVIADGVQIAPSAQVDAHASIDAGSRVGHSAVVGAGCVLGRDVTIGPDTRLAPRVTVLDGVRIGARCVLHAGAVVGADGFGFARDGSTWVKVPQLGSVAIGDDVEIGANTTIDRGTIEDTVIENGVKIDNLVQIAHNARIGEHTVMAAMSGVAGSTKVGKRCMIGGGVVLVNQISICDDVMFTFRSVVTSSVQAPGTYGGSLPAEGAALWRRNAARFRSLDKLAERLRAVERVLRNKRNGSEPERDDD